MWNNYNTKTFNVNTVALELFYQLLRKKISSDSTMKEMITARDIVFYTTELVGH